MRCKNCGWDNPDNIATCEKCNAPLDTQIIQEKTEYASENLRSTVSEEIAFKSSPNSKPNTCPQCGYPVSSEMNSCPNCNYVFDCNTKKSNNAKCPHCGQPIDSNARFCSSCGSPIDNSQKENIQRHTQKPGMGTIMCGPGINMVQNNFCTLKPIAWQGEDINYNPVTYSGDYIVLNRSNTDPNNNSITSKEQAIITHEDDNWYIENKSELRTTYIRIGDKIKIKSGDIIILGNREFEFKG